MSPHRRTGRTTRMFENAQQLSREGYAVYVIVLPAMIDTALWFLRDSPVKVETMGSMPFSLENMEAPGMHPDCVVLVDHHVIEQCYGPMLEMLHRYDEVDR